MSGAPPIRVRVRVLPHGEGLPLPAWQTAGAAGADLVAAVTEPLVLQPGDRAVVPTGLCLALPDGWEAQVRPRSGLAARFGVTVLNAPGTIDADYRGEVQVPLVNHGREPFRVARGDRIAQVVFAPVVRAAFEVVDALDHGETARGTGGFGSTGR
ncbi:MAG: dUTP diphosphatase [Myxococcota bacterium]